MKRGTFCWLLFVVGMGMVGSAWADEPIFIVTDTKGNKTEVRGLSIRIFGGHKNIYYSKDFPTQIGDSVVTFSLEKIAGLKVSGNLPGKKAIEIYFRNGDHVAARACDNLKFHSLTGKALIEGGSFDFKLPSEKVEAFYLKDFTPERQTVSRGQTSTYVSITDLTGRTFDIVQLKLKHVNSSDISYSDVFNMRQGMANLTIPIKSVKVFKNNWAKNEAALVLTEGGTLYCKIECVDNEKDFITGKVILGNSLYPYEIPCEKVSQGVLNGTPKSIVDGINFDDCKCETTLKYSRK